MIVSGINGNKKNSFMNYPSSCQNTKNTGNNRYSGGSRSELGEMQETSQECLRISVTDHGQCDHQKQPVYDITYERRAQYLASKFESNFKDVLALISYEEKNEVKFTKEAYSDKKAVAVHGTAMMK